MSATNLVLPGGKLGPRTGDDVLGATDGFAGDELAECDCGRGFRSADGPALVQKLCGAAAGVTGAVAADSRPGQVRSEWRGVATLQSAGTYPGRTSSAVR